MGRHVRQQCVAAGMSEAADQAGMGQRPGAQSAGGSTAWPLLPATSSPSQRTAAQIEAPVVVEPGVADGVAGLTLGLRPPQRRRDRQRRRRQCLCASHDRKPLDDPGSDHHQDRPARRNPDHAKRGAHAGRRARALSAASLLRARHAGTLRPQDAAAKPAAGAAASRRRPCLGAW